MKIAHMPKYSRGKWRLVDNDGREMDYMHPEKRYILPFCANTKAELVEKILAAYEDALSELASQRLLVAALKEFPDQKFNVAA